MRKYKTLHKILFALLGSILVVVLFLFISYFFRVKVVETNAYTYDMQGFPLVGQTYIFAVPLNKIETFFLKKPTVKKVTIIKRLPHSLFIDVSYREKTLEIIAKNGIFISDKEGMVFEKVATTSSNLAPKLDLSSKNVDLGTNIAQNNIKTALEIVEGSKNKNINIDYINLLEKEDLLITLTDGTVVIVGSNAQAEHIVSSLQTLLKRFTIEGTKISKIDFRFDKPYITF